MTPAKQISKYLQAWVGIAGFSTAGGTADTITTALTTALNTAGDKGASVPLQVGSAAQAGVNTAAGFNVTGIFSGATGMRFVDGNGNDVYAKITSSGSVWTLSYFSAPGGTETAFAMPASTSINFEVPYVFSFVDLPFTAITALISRHIAPDLAAYGTRIQVDPLTVTAANTLSALSQPYKSGGMFLLLVNNGSFSNAGAAPATTVAAKAVTWNPASAEAGFALAPGDVVVAIYQY